MPEKNFSHARDDANTRKFGEAPILGKVSRTPSSAVRGTNRKKVRGERRKKISKYVVVWTCLLSFCATCIILLAIVTYFRTMTSLPEGAAIGAGVATNLELAFTEQKTPALPSIEAQDALRITKSALANRDPLLVTEHFVLGEVRDPKEALNLLELIKKHEGEVTTMRWLGEKNFNDIHRAQIALLLKNDERQHIRLAQLVPSSDGKWRIDLDSFLRFVSPNWETILTAKSGTSLVRIFVAPDSYYNGIYADESLWTAYALSSPEVTNLLYGYAKRGSSQEKALKRILASEEPFHSVTLRIKKNSESGPRQFEISRVVAENWIIGESNFDESF